MTFDRIKKKSMRVCVFLTCFMVFHFSFTARAQQTPLLSIDWRATVQTIEGFGASSAWTGGDIPDAILSRFYNPRDVHYLGLTWLRVRIGPEGWVQGWAPKSQRTRWNFPERSELKAALRAQSWGVKIWAAPWSPPKEWKSNRGLGAGRLEPKYYSDYAEHLAKALQTVAGSDGLRVQYLSVQNEPDYKAATWESCYFTAQELATFAGVLGSTLLRRGINTGLLGPETGGVYNFAQAAGSKNPQDRAYSDYAAAIHRDSNARKYVKILATHYYDDRFGAPPRLLREQKKYQKPVWITEASADEKPNSGLDIDWGIALGRKMHRALFEGEVNAWHHWWILRNPHAPEHEGLLNQDQSISKRGFAIAHYARFIRPGARQLRLKPEEITPGLMLSAYRTRPLANPKLEQMVLVGINPNAEVLTQDIWVKNVAFVKINDNRTVKTAGFITDATRDLKYFGRVNSGNREADKYRVIFPGKSMVTWVFHVKP
jgi:O-glycosyl hydrolase